MEALQEEIVPGHMVTMRLYCKDGSATCTVAQCNLLRILCDTRMDTGRAHVKNEGVTYIWRMAHMEGPAEAESNMHCSWGRKLV